MIVELVSFRIFKSVDEGEFVNLAESLKPFLNACNGFVRRHLSKNEDGSWIDHIEWKTLEDAHAAMDKMESVPEIAPFMAAIDPDSVVMKHNVLVLKQE